MNSDLQPGHHPDADQLSAFAEHALPPHQQQQTLAHLAACPECRALVYLTQQAYPIESWQPQSVATRRPWFSGWLSGWGLAIPATAIACLLLLTLYLRNNATPHSQGATTASVKQPQPPIPGSPTKALVAPTSPVRISPKSTHATGHRKQLPIAANQLTAAAAVVTAAPVAPTPIAPPPIVQEAQLTPQTPERGQMVQRAKASGGSTGQGGTIENELYSSLPLSMQGGPRDPTAFQYLMPGVQENPANATNQASTAGASGIYGGTGQTNLNQNYVEGVPVSNIAAQGGGTAAVNEVTANATDAISVGAIATGLANRKPLPTLPSKLPAHSVVDNASRTLALDTAGALFRSDDAGVTWHPVPIQWQGHALTLRVIQLVSSTQQATARDAANDDGARQQTQTLAPPASSFELTTDTGFLYTSSDGQTWQRK